MAHHAAARPAAVCPAHAVQPGCILAGIGRIVECDPFPSAGWATFAALIWLEVGWVATSLLLWGLAGRLLPVRQGKRLFGFIGAGGGVASILGGLLTPLLASRFGVANLLLIPLAAVALTRVLLVYVAWTYRDQVHVDLHQQEQAEQLFPDCIAYRKVWCVRVFGGKNCIMICITSIVR